MPQFVMLARHSPDLCPTANSKTRQLMKQSAKEIPDIAKRLGLKLITVNVYGPDHEILAVVEASGIEPVREFAMQSRLMQWNTVNINATWSMEEAMDRMDTLPAIF